MKARIIDRKLVLGFGNLATKGYDISGWADFRYMSYSYFNMNIASGKIAI